MTRAEYRAQLSVLSNHELLREVERYLEEREREQDLEEGADLSAEEPKTPRRSRKRASRRGLRLVNGGRR